MTTPELLLIAGACTAGGMLVGVYARRTRERTIDRVTRNAFFGRGANIAWIFTRLGYSPALSGIFFLLGVIEFTATRSLIGTLVLLVAQLLSQQIVNAVKRQFKRQRPVNWLKREELTHAFPSGHATTAAVVFGTLYFIAGSVPLSIELLLTLRGILAVIILGLGWSRIALGAHHCTDVIGGYLFGAAVVCGLLAALPILQIAR